MIRGFVGSPNRNGRTSAIVREALLGAEEQGADVELVQLADYSVSDVADCNVEHQLGVDAGPDDDFRALAMMVESADAVVFGSPVYWSTITSSVRALLSRILRVEMGEGPTAGMPALGIVLAGGSGNGLTEAMKPLYLLFEKLRWRPLDCFPVTRFNWDRALAFANGAGRDLAAMADRRRPIPAEMVWTFYNDLKYRHYDRIDERRLLAELIVGSLPEVGKFAEVATDLRDKNATVTTLFQQHRKAEAVPIIDDMIARGTELWEVLSPSGRAFDEVGD
jgi:NAD(P)H-dependent FMN reductase